MANIDPIHPGEVLLEEFLGPLDVTQHRLAVSIGVPPRRINEIVHGKRRITADTALRLARYFGTTDRFWLNLQTRYDLEVERDRLAGLHSRPSTHSNQPDGLLSPGLSGRPASARRGRTCRRWWSGRESVDGIGAWFGSVATGLMSTSWKPFFSKTLREPCCGVRGHQQSDRSGAAAHFVHQRGIGSSRPSPWPTAVGSPIA